MAARIRRAAAAATIVALSSLVAGSVFAASQSS